MRAAGRTDLVRGIVRAGGVASVAAEFGLGTKRRERGCWVRRVGGGVEGSEALGRELRALGREAGCEDGVLVSTGVLLREGRCDLVNAVAQAGGVGVVAQAFGMVTLRERRRMEGEEAVQEKVVRVRGEWGSWKVFESALREFAEKQTGGAMPTQAELRDGGRGDLLNALRRHGGVDVVSRRAALLMRGSKRPRGHWTDRAVMRAELGAHTASFGKPGLLPRREELLRAGRTDLVYAIARHGGFSAVAAEMHLMWHGPSSFWRDFRNLNRRLHAWVKREASGRRWVSGVMPGTDRLSAEGRQDLILGIAMHGGVMNVAWRTRLAVRHVQRPAGFWEQPKNVVRELRRFIETQPLESRNAIPSSVTLVEAGRGDLANVLRDCGGWVFYAQRMGLRHNFAVRAQGFWHEEGNVFSELKRYVERRYGDWDYPGVRSNETDIAFDDGGSNTAHSVLYEEKRSRRHERSANSVTVDAAESDWFRTEVVGSDGMHEARGRLDWSKRTLLVMPSVEMLKRDGRSDLAFAIQQHQGGEFAFALRHGLIIAADSSNMRPHEVLAKWSNFGPEMLKWIDDHGCVGCMPLRSDLVQTGRNDLRYAIYSHGGNLNVGRRLGLVSLLQKDWVANWLAMQAALLGLYISMPPEKRCKLARTGEEELPTNIKGGRGQLALTNFQERAKAPSGRRKPPPAARRSLKQEIARR